MKLRDYQDRAIADLRQSLKSGKKRPVVQAPTGAGKTVIAAAIVKMAREKNKTVLFTVPSLSLIDQTVERFRQNGITDVGVMQGQHEMTDYRMPVQVCSVQTLARRVIPRADLIIVDECFSADTKILTPNGEVRIENIKAGDKILCATGYGQVMSISCKKAQTITLGLSNGRSIKVTREHPFFTEQGWTKAEGLGVGSYVYSPQDMLALWSGDGSEDISERSASVGEKLERKQILWDVLCKEAREPNEQECRPREDAGNFVADKTCADQKRREREIASIATISFASCFGGRMASGSGITDEDAKEFWLSNKLQNGFGKSPNKMGDRNRRPVPHGAQEKTGYKKGCFTGSIRVESVTFDERSSDEPVFNLHVSGHPSYFAEGVLVHNCHVMFKLYDKWMADPDWGKVPFIGLTATPWAKGMGAEGRWDDLIIGTTTAELIGLGHLSDFKVFAPAHPDLSGVKTVAGDYDLKGLGHVMDNNNLVADIVSTWLEKADNRPTICFAVNRLHAKNIQNQFEQAGVKAAYMDAFTNLQERAEIVKQFENGDVKIICNVGVLTTGFDSDVRCVILARPTKSEILYTQMIGRGLRTANGKDHCLILDHSDTTLRLGFVTDISSSQLDDGSARRTVKEKAEPLPKECPSCHFLRPPKVKTCPACGFVAQPKCEVVTEEGELLELTRDKKVRVKNVNIHEKQNFYSELITHATMRGYKKGWAAHAYRDKFKVWPATELRAIPAPMISPATESWIIARNIRKAKREENRRSA